MSVFDFRIEALSLSSVKTAWLSHAIDDGVDALIYDYTGGGHNLSGASNEIPTGYGYFGPSYGGAIGYMYGGSHVYSKTAIGTYLPDPFTTGFSVMFENVGDIDALFSVRSNDSSKIITFFVDKTSQTAGVRIKGDTDTTHVFAGLYSAIVAKFVSSGSVFGHPLTFSMGQVTASADLFAYFNGVEYSIANAVVYGSVSDYANTAVFSGNGGIYVIEGDFTVSDMNVLSGIYESTSGTVSSSDFNSSNPSDQSTLSDIINGSNEYNPDSPIGGEQTVPVGGNMMSTSDSMSVSDSSSMRLSLTIGSSDGVSLSESLSTKTIATRGLVDAIRFRSKAVFESNIHKSYSVNKNTGAASRYDGFFFESFITTGNGKVYGVRPDGIYAIEGYSDEEFEIDASITTGYARFNGEGQKRAVSAYIAGEITGEANLVVTSDKDDSWKYRVNASGEYGNTRVKIGKGLSGYSLMFELQTKGKMDIDSLNVDALYKSRRS